MSTQSGDSMVKERKRASARRTGREERTASGAYAVVNSVMNEKRMPPSWLQQPLSTDYIAVRPDASKYKEDDERVRRLSDKHKGFFAPRLLLTNLIGTQKEEKLYLLELTRYTLYQVKTGLLS